MVAARPAQHYVIVHEHQGSSSDYCTAHHIALDFRESTVALVSLLNLRLQHSNVKRCTVLEQLPEPFRLSGPVTLLSLNIFLKNQDVASSEGQSSKPCKPRAAGLMQIAVMHAIEGKVYDAMSVTATSKTVAVQVEPIAALSVDWSNCTQCRLVATLLYITCILVHSR